jgi:hypothetical protein
VSAVKVVGAGVAVRLVIPCNSAALLAGLHITQLCAVRCINHLDVTLMSAASLLQEFIAHPKVDEQLHNGELFQVRTAACG